MPAATGPLVRIARTLSALLVVAVVVGGALRDAPRAPSLGRNPRSLLALGAGHRAPRPHPRGVGALGPRLAVRAVDRAGPLRARGRAGPALEPAPGGGPAAPGERAVRASARRFSGRRWLCRSSRAGTSRSSSGSSSRRPGGGRSRGTTGGPGSPRSSPRSSAPSPVLSSPGSSTRRRSLPRPSRGSSLRSADRCARKGRAGSPRWRGRRPSSWPAVTTRPRSWPPSWPRRSSWRSGRLAGRREAGRRRAPRCGPVGAVPPAVPRVPLPERGVDGRRSPPRRSSRCGISSASSSPRSRARTRSKGPRHLSLAVLVLAALGATAGRKETGRAGPPRRRRDPPPRGVRRSVRPAPLGRDAGPLEPDAPPPPDSRRPPRRPRSRRADPPGEKAGSLRALRCSPSRSRRGAGRSSSRPRGASTR